MLRFALSLLALVALPATLLSQQPTWTRTYGGPEGERGDAVIATSDGGHLVGAYTSSYPKGWAKLYLVKTDGDGLVQWEKTIAAGRHAELLAMQQASSNSFVIVSRVLDSNERSGWRVHRTVIDRAGNASASSYVGDANSFASRAEQTRDGGHIVVGSRANNGFLMRMTPDGTLAWDRAYDQGQFESAEAVTEMSNGDFVLTGLTNAAPSVNWDVWLLRVNGQGDSLWSRALGTSRYETGTAVLESQDGNILIAARTGGDPNGSQWSFYLLKTDSAGVFEGSQTTGAVGNNRINRLHRTADGQVLALGTVPSRSVAKYPNAYIAKYTDDWKLRWEVVWGPNGAETEATRAAELPGGGYVVTGVHGRDAFLMKLGAEPPTSAPLDVLLPHVLDLR